MSAVKYEQTMEELESGYESSLEEISEEIARAAHELLEQTKTVDTVSRRIIKRIKHDVYPDTPLKPKAGLSSWLKAQGIEQETISFEDFFDMFLEKCELDYESFELRMKKEEAKLFHMPPNTAVSLFTVLSQIPSIFE